MSLLNADLLHTPPDGTGTTTGDAMMKDDVSFEWALSETPIAYFAESPPARTPPPPKRNTRIRTPFAKAPIHDDDDDDVNSDIDCAPSMQRKGTKKKKSTIRHRHSNTAQTNAAVKSKPSTANVATPTTVNKENHNLAKLVAVDSTLTVCATSTVEVVVHKENPEMKPAPELEESAALNMTTVKEKVVASTAPEATSVAKHAMKPAPVGLAGGDSHLSTSIISSAASDFVVEKEDHAVAVPKLSEPTVSVSLTIPAVAMDSSASVLPTPPSVNSATSVAPASLPTHTKAMESTLTQSSKPATSLTIAEDCIPLEQPGLAAPADAPNELSAISATWDMSPEQPRKRKAPTESTPKRRSTRRASLLSSTKIHRILVPSSSKATPLTAVSVSNDIAKASPLCTLETVATKATIHNMLPTGQPPLPSIDVKNDPISSIDDLPADLAPVVGTPEKRGPIQAPALDIPTKGTIDLGLDSTFSTKRKRSTRRASLSSPYRSSKYDDEDNVSHASVKSMASAETTMKSTIELDPEISQCTKQQRKLKTRRRASMSVLGSTKLSPASSLEPSLSPTGTLGSIFLDDCSDTPNTKRRRSSRRASISSMGSSAPLSSLELIGQEKTGASQGRVAMHESSNVCLSTKPESSAPPQVSTENRHLNTATTKLHMSNTNKGSFKLPPLPKTLTSSKRGGARRKSFSTVAKKSSVLKITDESGRVLEYISLSAPEPKLEGKIMQGGKPTISPTVPENVVPAMEVEKSTAIESAAATQRISELPSPVPVKPDHLEHINLSISIPPPPVARQPPETKPSQPENKVSEPAKLEVVQSKPSPLVNPKPPSTVLDKPLVGPSPVPKAVLALRNFNAPTAQTQSTPTIQSTPGSIRRSSRRASMSASSALSRSGRKLTSSASRPCRVPGSSTKRRLLPSAEKTSTPGLATLTEEQQQTIHIDALTIKTCAAKLFGNNRIKSEVCSLLVSPHFFVDHSLFLTLYLLFSCDQACVSARIFASYALTHNHGSRNLGNLSMRVKPLMPLLTSLVNVEMTSLDERDIVTSRIRKENRRVHFSGFDCSSTKPPVEAKVGSHEHQQDCISDMMLASDQIQTLIKHSCADAENDVESSLVVRAVKSLLHFLSKMSNDTHLKRECALVSVF